ncbi:8944_t:CDS:2 [Funneliformis geosporum]|uniref:17052_t:CDS:1 n=1 Tax=Funneliformis geosporum TaxID=1117311 RepID=A0A9W4WZM5_9GLOM|nr:17052_t:CDS:2 [Funneliformis geosporum]CAI2186235.1 8944_t:CDS:2 [Funneliformis geosporum]
MQPHAICFLCSILKNKHVTVAINEESLQENVRNVKSDDEIIWGDDDLDCNQEDLIQNLMTQMQNYVPPACRSTYIGNSARTKCRHHAQAKRDAKKKWSDN